jgi:RNA polymerase sigma-70 factor (ECF subfamily)
MTRWTTVIEVARQDSPEGRCARNELCGLYWFPLYALAVRRGYSKDDAADLTQGFFTRFLTKNDIADADRNRGRFRCWLQTCFKYYLANCWKHEQSQQNAGIHLPFDIVEGERCYQAALADCRTPETVFERAYTIGLLRRVLEAVEREWTRKNRLRQFRRLSYFITHEDKGPYAIIADELLTSEDAVKQEIKRLRDRYADLLRDEVRKTVDHAEEVDDELRRLLLSLVEERRPPARRCTVDVEHP